MGEISKAGNERLRNECSFGVRPNHAAECLADAKFCGSTVSHGDSPERPHTGNFGQEPADRIGLVHRFR